MLHDFRRGNLATISKCASKALTKATPFPNQTSKPNFFRAQKAKANNLFLTANV